MCVRVCVCASSIEPAPSPHPLSLPDLGPCLCLHGAWHAAVRPATLSQTVTWSRGSPRGHSSHSPARPAACAQRCDSGGCADGRVQQQRWIPVAPQGGHGYRWARTQPPQPWPGAGEGATGETAGTFSCD